MRTVVSIFVSGGEPPNPRSPQQVPVHLLYATCGDRQRFCNRQKSNPSAVHNSGMCKRAGRQPGIPALFPLVYILGGPPFYLGRRHHIAISDRPPTSGFRRIRYLHMYGGFLAVSHQTSGLSASLPDLQARGYSTANGTIASLDTWEPSIHVHVLKTP
ncbi:hypothetical protein EDC04DRAFT_2741677 [Pisolithus marmoratus]|nr:hypothetical protein EDC04DRAFT_2741677 [Pisolithus marmoratus]